MITNIAILFCTPGSVYKTLPGCDVFDVERDARNFRGGMPVVAHPPCAQWGQLRYQANYNPAERELATFALYKVRENGGVLEHPFRSFLWEFIGLPEPGDLKRDWWGGWTMAVPQFWFGHKANKATKLYVCGCEPNQVPAINFKLGEAKFTCSQSRSGKPEIKKAERHATPKPFAEFLIEIARRCGK